MINPIECDAPAGEPPPTAADSRDTAGLNQRARRGVKLLLGRQVILQLLTFGGGVILARVLDPAEFGLYAIATFLVGTIAMFGDFGLSPLLIQRKEQIKPTDLQVGFTLQQIVTTVVVAILWFSAPLLASLYPKAPPETIWLIRALAFTLYLSSWRTIGALQLERDLKYGAMARVEVVEGILYQSIAVILALLGFGVWSFICATVARASVGGLLLYLASPWKMQFHFDRKVARELLHYGFPFQLQVLANQLSNWATPLLVGSLIGPTAVGYLTWASSNGKKPLILVDNVMRVAFPHFSRLQHSHDELHHIIGRYITCLVLPAGVWFAVLLTSGESIVRLIYTDKWIDAVPALILFASALAFDVIGWVISTGLTSIGIVAFPARIVLIRSVIALGLSVPLVASIGYNGVPLAMLIAAAITVPVMLFRMGKGVLDRITRDACWVILPIICSIAVGYLLKTLPAFPWHYPILSAGIVTSVYCIVTWMASPHWFRSLCTRTLLRNRKIVGLGT